MWKPYSATSAQATAVPHRSSSDTVSPVLRSTTVLRRFALLPLLLLGLVTIAALMLVPRVVQAQGQSQDENAVVWSADMLVVEYTEIAIGAASSDLFSNIGGSGNLQIKSLWSYLPDRDLRLAFTDGVPDAADMTLKVGDLELEFPAGSSGEGSFKWTGVDVDWKDGDTVAVSIVRTSTLTKPEDNTQATGGPTVTGTPQVDQTLTADTSSISDEDGLESVSYEYQWIRSDNGADTDIAGATEASYTLVFADQGKTIKVKVTFTDDAENEETLTSEATGIVEAAPNRAATGDPTISGTPQVNRTLTAGTSAISDEDGLDEVSYEYQWLAGETDIPDATEATYTPSSEDVGKTIKVKVSFTDDRNNAETLTSAATVAVVAAPNREATGQPTIDGTPQVGETLTANTANVADQDGLTNVSYSYQWIAGGTDIAGATGSTYGLVPADAGSTIEVRVSFTDDRGNSESLTSEATVAVAATTPTEPLSLTVATGDQVQELVASWQAPESNGGSVVTGYRVQWKEAADSWDTAADVSEATETGTTHTITGLTGGVEYAVRVIATNSAGDGPASAEAKGTPAGAASEQTSEAENSAPTGLPTISGTPQVDETLTGDTSAIDDADGLTNVSYRYQWIADGVDIAGATGASYTLTASELGKTIQVRVTFTDDAENEESLTSEATEAVAAKANTVPTGLPTITGTPQVEQTLTADTSSINDADGLDDVSWEYQWIADGVDIAGATGSTYTLTASEQSKAVSVKVTFTDDADNAETLTSEATVAVAAAPNRDAEGTPTIDGTPEVEQTLTAGTSGITDADGLDNVSWRYQWIVGGVDITGAISSTYELTSSEQGKTIQVRVTFTDDRGNDESLTSEATAAVAARPNRDATGLPTISGTPEVEQTLTVDTTDINDEDGLENVTYEYQWLADDTDIAGATGASYTLTASEQGKTIKVKVSFTDDAEYAESLTSEATDAVAARPNTAPTGLPTIGGTPQVDETLTADTSAIADKDGLANVIYNYQWIRSDGSNDSDIAGQTLSTYMVASVDAGKTIKVRVSFTDDANNQEVLTSEATAEVTPGPNSAATGLPTIVRRDSSYVNWVYVGQKLWAFTDFISDNDGLDNATYTYQWIRNDGTSDTDINGETAFSYVLSDDDVDKTIKVRVDFTDDAGNEESLISAATGVVRRYNRRAVGGARIFGYPRLGLTLVAITSDIIELDGLANATFSYQWIRSDGDADTDINGATGLTYKLSDDDVGKTIKVRVSFADDAGNEEAMISGATSAVRIPYRPNVPATGAPTISGTAHVGHTLTADLSDIDDDDGLWLIDTRYSGHAIYQWAAGGTDIDGATGASYTLTSGEVGKTVQVRVSFTDDWGHGETLTSAATDAVNVRPNTPATGAPTISGTAQEGETLAADTSGIADSDGLFLTNATFSYQWVAGGSDIDGATGASYIPTSGEVGKTIQVRVSFVDDWGNGETLTSAATDAVTARPNTPAAGFPTIRGQSHVGETLTANISGIADLDGLTNATFSYQWIRNDGTADTDIEDEREQTYMVVDADVGKTIKVRVSFTDDWGEGETLTSAAILAVANWVAQDRPIWSADMTVRDLGNGSIGVFDANLFSNQQGSAGLQAKWLWYYTPTRKLRLAFTDEVPDTEDLTLQVGDVALSLQGGEASFSWEDVDVDWEDGQISPARIVRTSVAANTPAAGAPTISGTAQVGETLTADTSGIADADGLTKATFNYQWISSDGNVNVDIEDATASTYELSSEDFGKTIKVRVSFADDAGLAESLTSGPTTAVVAKPNSPAAGAPIIRGTAHVGYTLTADTSGITDEDGLSDATFSYQWIANDGRTDRDITNATGLNYELSIGEVGKTIKLRVSFADAVGRAESLTSEPTLAVTGDNRPAVGVPTISGATQLGETLTAETAGITDLDGLGNVSFRYQWVRVDGGTDAEIAEGTDSSYELGGSDKGKRIKVRVSFTDDEGYEESLTSEPTAQVTDDHGDTPEDATDLPMSGRERGEIEPYEDVDYFRIEIEPEQAGYIRLWLSETILSRDVFRFQPPYAHYALFDSDGLCVTRYCEAGGGYKRDFYGYAPPLTVRLEAGTYYLRVTGPPSSVGVDPNPERRDYSVVLEWHQDNFDRWASTCQALDDDKYDDPLYGCQNSLKNRKHPGEDINVEPAWDDGVLGSGIKVVVVDRWIDDLHEDLLGAVDVEKSETGYYSDTGIDLHDDHGIMVAGIIAAQHNSKGIRGIAPKSTLFHFLTDTGAPFYSFRAMTLAHREVAVSNNSWGLADGAINPISMPGNLRDGIQKGIKQGFGGKGISYIFGAPNAVRNSNLSELENYYAVTTVCGVSETGGSPNYGAGGYGSNLWVCAPIPHLTTIHNDYYGSRGGTSSATPAVSGVVALIRSANRDLTWRDVKVILADSARQNDPEHAEWTTGAAKYGSPSNVYRYNEEYGFGVVDAGAAVQMAKAWDLLPPMKTASADSGNLDLTIPDAEDGVEPITVSSTLALDTAVGFVEFVEVSIKFDHPSFRDLEVELVSPRGTVSMLTDALCCSRNPEFRGTHRFGSAKHLGEDPAGTWTLRLTDHVTGQEGGIKNWSIKVYGHEVTQATSLPTIAGVAQVGETLTADTSGVADSYGVASDVFSFQWVSNDGSTDAVIEDATDSTYRLSTNDVGKNIKVKVSFTDVASNDVTLTSEATATVVAESNTSEKGVPTISGTVQVGQTLTADTAPITDPDGITNAVFSYQWLRGAEEGDTEITDATRSTYDLTDDDLEHSIKVRISFTDDGDNEETRTSQATVAVADKPNTLATGAPTISGTAQVGETLTADTSAITDLNGLDDVSYRFQWLRSSEAGDKEITDATRSTYELTDDDLGHSIKVRVTFTDDADNEETLTSQATAEVTVKPNTPATGVPTIDGTPQVDATLTADTSSITDSDGLTDPTFEYQWMANDTDIDDATDSTYQLAASDVGKTIRVKVSFVDDRNNHESLTSEATDTVTATKPGIPGGVQVSARATGVLDVSWDAPASDGGSDITGYKVQWKEASDSWDTEADVSEATETGTTRTITGLTDGTEYSVRVSAMNGIGEGPVSADVSGIPQPAAIWSATLTVGSAEKFVGYTTFVLGSESPIRGALSSDTITLDDVIYTVKALGVLDGTLILSVTPKLDTRFALVAGTDEFKSGGASTKQSASVLQFRWDDPGLDWSEGETVHVKITEPDANTPPTGSPTIIGTPQVDQTLTADTSAINDADGLTNVSYRYQWLAGGSDIAGATGSTYRLVPADAGSTIEARVSFTDDRGNSESLTSEATVGVAATTPTEPLSLTVTQGSQDRQLDASWQAPESNGGSVVTGYRVQWKEAADSWDTAADVSEVTETGTTHTITGLTGGVEYAVRVIATNSAGDGPASAEAKGTPAVAASEQTTEAENSAPTGLPTISGTPQVEQTLTANTSAINDSDGLTNVSYQYQWLAGGVDIAGATGASYTLTASEQGKTIKVKVTFTDDAENEESLTSEATTAVAAKANTVPTGLPTITGTPQVEQTLTASTSSINDADGLDDVSWQYQWVADGVDITGATSSSYTLTANEQGKTIQVRVTFEDDEGNSESLTSVATVAVAAKPTPEPVIVSNPLAGFSIVDASTTPQVSLGTLTDNATLTLDDPSGGSYGIRVNIKSGEQVGSVRLQLSGAKSIDHTEGIFPYSLYGDGGVGNLNGANLPVGSYTLTATAYSEGGLRGDQLGTLSVSFSVAAAATNSPATGLPTISGTPQVEQTLTASTSAINDADGLDDASWQYQWLADGVAIAGATGSSYTLTANEQGKSIRVKVSFSDDTGNTETLTSAATLAVTAAPAQEVVVPTVLTASFSNVPASHDGTSEFTFTLSFSENVESGYARIRDDAFTVSDGDKIKEAKRVTKGSNQQWTIRVQPGGNSDVVLTLPQTTDCAAAGAICSKVTEGKMLSKSLIVTVPGPTQ